MGDKSGIEWTDATWNPVRGCSRVSEGCRNCYAERVAARFSGIGQPHDGLAKMTPSGPRWTGKLRFIPQHLEDPLRWQRPRRIFVNSMSDLFHDEVSNEEIAAIFAVMMATPHHIYQVLTKRPQRMLEWFQWASSSSEYDPRELCENHGLDYVAACHLQADMCDKWPLPNVWIGVSVEDQKTANERIPYLLKTPAAIRFLSCEPLLRRIDLGQAHPCGYYCEEPTANSEGAHHDHDFWTPGINTSIKWVIVGGESGPNARPMHPTWVRSLRDQCETAGVAFFFKQWGEWLPDDQLDERNRRDPMIGETDMTWMRVGKKKAGRLLDGVEWNQFPQVLEFSRV
ncbi:MAG TPA: phage Gp37/Gp68 family protein [Blastocatellia bacterium]|nr:phage Gp37/Gp68 family protein [Blastocatellia bacterium]